VLAQDTAVAVRRAVVESMKTSRQLPRDVAERLAQDVETLAVPILQSSPILTDPFLLHIVRASSPDKQIAIAARPQVSPLLADGLVEHGGERTLETLAANRGAALREHHLAQMLERFPASGGIAAKVAERPQVPAHILEYLVATASDAIKAQIKSRPDYSHHVTTALDQGREQATLRLLGRERDDKELAEVARQLIDSDRLTASLVLRALCMGYLRFFEVALATAAKVPLKNARILIHDQGEAGLKALYDRTSLLPKFLPAIRHALEVIYETTYDGGPDDMERYRRRLMERILTDPRGMLPEDIEYLLDRLSDLEAPARVA
jgi:uncharacterized protein (DUF2336 family)